MSHYLQMKYVFCISLFSLLISPSLGGFAKEKKVKIQWYTYSLQPYHIENDPQFANQGIGDSILEIWKNQLQHFDHTPLNVNIPRMLSILASPRFDGCVVGTFITPSIKKNLYWTEQIYVETPPMIVLKKQLWKQLQSPKELSVSTLLSNSKLRFGRIKGRGLGPAVDAILKKAKGQPNIFMLSSKEATRSLVSMVKMDRMDWGIIFPTELAWILRDNLPNTDLITVPITEHKAGTPVHAGCAKNIMGKSIVLRLNKSLKDKKNLDAIRKSFELWLPDERSKEVFHDLNSFEY